MLPAVIALGFIGFHWVSLGFIGFHWVSLGFIGFHWVSLGFIAPVEETVYLITIHKLLYVETELRRVFPTVTPYFMFL